MTTRVVNKKHGGMPANGVYIGRPSKWGNPFVIGRDGTRDEVIAKYRQWFARNGDWDGLRQLKGKLLVCWCAPAPCHGDWLALLAEEC